MYVNPWKDISAASQERSTIPSSVSYSSWAVTVYFEEAAEAVMLVLWNI